MTHSLLDGRDGSVIWRTPVPTYWSNKDLVIADVTGDGTNDIVVDEPKYGVDGVGVFDLHTGKEKGWFPVKWGETRGPVAGDLYGDGKLELVVPVATGAPGTNYRSLDVGWRQGALEIIATGSPYKAAFSANFWLTDDQKMVSHGTGGSAPPPPSTSPPPVTSTPVTTNPTAQPTGAAPTGQTTTTVTTTTQHAGGRTTLPSESSDGGNVGRTVPPVAVGALLPAVLAAALLLRTRKR